MPDKPLKQHAKAFILAAREAALDVRRELAHRSYAG
jgi:hypothetical protein